MRERILNYMKEYGSITSKEAFEQLGCTRLAVYINIIKKTHLVHDEWVTSKNRFGEKVRFKKYYLGE